MNISIAEATLEERPVVRHLYFASTAAKAQAYWRKVIAEYTNGQYAEHLVDTEEWHGPVQTFVV